LLKLTFAALAAKVVSLSFVRGLGCGLLIINLHSADRISDTMALFPFTVMAKPIIVHSLQ